MEQLFVYGSLINWRVHQKVVGRKIQGKVDLLKGYRKSTVTIKGKTYPIIVPDAHSLVEGVVLSVTKKELNIIDQYEGKPYKRRKVTLSSGTKAWVYLKA